MTSHNLVGAIEIGGTKIVCGLFDRSTLDSTPNLVAEGRIPTTVPAETLAQTAAWFSEHLLGRPLASLGIASFGPVEPRRNHPDFGCILKTPKVHWSGTDVVGFFEKALGVPVGFDSDVNGAALAEYRWGAGVGRSCVVYVTVGTGIGGGVVVNGAIHHGAGHPEMGHIRLPRLPGDTFAGSCPFHGDCLEGLAAGQAVEQRWNARGESLSADHPAWDLEADYIAMGLASITMVLSPDRIVLGGGLGGRPDILAAVRTKLPGVLGGYVTRLDNTEAIRDFLVAPGLGDRSGLFGAAALAE